jgi:hypothetical protein
MLKNASEVTLVPKIFFFLIILNFVQSFVECKVSLPDGELWEKIWHIMLAASASCACVLSQHFAGLSTRTAGQTEPGQLGL